MFFVVYVDDILIVGDTAATRSVKMKLASVFTTTDLGVCTHFLGIKIESHVSSFVLSQSAHEEKILSAAGIEEFQPIV